MSNINWIQFCKAPVLGKVKTRLAVTVGNDAALAAHIELSKAVNAQLRNFIDSQHGASDPGVSNQSLSLSFAALGDGADELNRLGDLSSDAVVWQSEGDLGTRMQSALNEAAVSASKAFIVGSDFPVLDGEYLEQAISLLDHSDLVLGPTLDGGFGLIGTSLKEIPSFCGIEWGSEKVLSQTKSWAAANDLSVALLPERFDVDTLDDYNSWKKSRWYRALSA